MIISVKKVGWIVFWTLLMGMSLYFYIGTFAEYAAGYIPPNFLKGFFESKIWFIGHVLGASASLLLGPMQFWDSFRMRFLKYHRAAGKVFVVGSLLAAVCAFRINLMYDCAACRLSLGILSVIWFFVTAAAWWAIRNKNIKAHRQFMVRSYTCALAFVFIRIFPVIGYKNAFPFVTDQMQRRISAEWLCWVIPLLVVEIYMIWWPSLQRKSKTSFRE